MTGVRCRVSGVRAVRRLISGRSQTHKFDAHPGSAALLDGFAKFGLFGVRCVVSGFREGIGNREEGTGKRQNKGSDK